MNDAIRMQISAFVDGELPDNEADLLLRRMGQDAELRQKVAEYLAIGRLMRGEASLPGVDRIHERVSAVLDDKPFEDQEDAQEQPQSRAIRPLAGVAIAASVALLAIFGLQQMSAVGGPDTDVPITPLAEAVEDVNYTAPDTVDDQLRQYYISHGQVNGDSFFDARDVAVWSSELAIEEDPDDRSATGEEEPETTDEAPAQP